jgi:hypothetical protein
MIRATQLRVSPAIPLTLLAVAALVLTPCQRGSKPSAEFAKAHELFTRLYGAKLEEAYADPQMGQVEEWLHQVPPDSMDFSAAQALLTRIREGRKQLTQQEAKFQATVNRLTSAESYGRMSAAGRPPGDAGQPTKEAGPDLPMAGMPVAEFTSKFSRCFTPWETVTLFDKGVERGKASSWELKDIGNCRDLYPGFAQRLVLANDQKVIATIEKSTIERRPVDAGLVGGDR